MLFCHKVVVRVDVFRFIAFDCVVIMPTSKIVRVIYDIPLETNHSHQKGGQYQKSPGDMVILDSSTPKTGLSYFSFIDRSPKKQIFVSS